ncbi:MAG: FAD-dependent oxidoreductase [Bauldia sp.]|nr:FAD-dependent oxidoreductase [Bauldia sp.]
MTVTRRSAIGLLAATGAAAIAMPNVARGATGNVVVIGGGFGGATAAKYLKLRSPELSVTLIEPAEVFYTCPFSNLYLGGLWEFEAIGQRYDVLASEFGVEVVRDRADDVDVVARTVRLAGGASLAYDALVMSPGIDIRWDGLEGYGESAAGTAPHAWKAGPQTELLRAQLEAMPDGGTFVMVAPDNPFRCPPGPYERASLVANYFKTHKPASKVLILDAKDAFSKQARFTEGWAALYGDMISWVSRSNDGRVIRVDADALEVETEFGQRIRADVLNVIPPQRAGLIAERAGLTNNSGWVPINPATFEAAAAPGVFVVGDATISAPMPKSGFAANAQGKVVAANIVALLEGREPPRPSWLNTCYSLVGPNYGISVVGAYRLVDGAITEVMGSGGVSPVSGGPEFRAREAANTFGWYHAITNDIWGTVW